MHARKSTAKTVTNIIEKNMRKRLTPPVHDGIIKKRTNILRVLDF
ncbi:MAG: hypothetical protein PHR10_06705 [Sphaerochaetaceae bacterium]|nr:hypothetical protein [Sphaerochaetaceae bacterium]